MKNNIRRFVFAGLCLFGVWSGFAQSNQGVEVFDQEICRGVSIIPNGILYKLKGGYEITSITADNLPGEELKAADRFTPQSTTVYTIVCRPTGGGSSLSAKVTVTVHQRPSLSVEFVNESTAVSDGMVCEGTELQFRVKSSANLNGNPVYWYVSTLDKPASGNTFSFRAQNSCEVTALANNGYCPIADTTLKVRVFTPPTPGNVDVTWNTEWTGTFCQTCGFFPGLQDILKDGTDKVDYANSSIEWEEGGTNEKTLAAGTNTYRLRIHYKVRRQNRCGDLTLEHDTVVTLRLNGVKDCTPTLNTASLTVKPCEEAHITLTNAYQGTLFLKDNGAVEPTVKDLSNPPVSGEWGFSTAGLQTERGREVYNWNVTLQKYTSPKTWAGFQVSGTAKMSCPYSKTEKVKTVPYSMNVSVKTNLEYLSSKYEYCPGAKGNLEFSVPEQINGVSNPVSMTRVDFLNPAGAGNRFTKQASSTASKYIYETNEAVNAGNVANYSPLTVKAVYAVKIVKGNLNCQFTQEEEQEVSIQPRDGCDISFELAGDKCIGEARTLTIKGGSGESNKIEVTGIRIEDNGSLAIQTGGFSTADNQGQLVFYPYYAGAPDLASKTDTITVTATYKMKGVASELKWTKKFEVAVQACPPLIYTYTVGRDCRTCMACPGTQVFISLNFQNTTTDRTLCRLDWRPEPYTPPLSNSGWPGNRMTYQHYAYYYTDTKVQAPVIYNEGDSIYSIALEKLTDAQGKVLVQNADFAVNPACAMRVVPDQDACCMNDEIEADIINGNLGAGNVVYSQFQELIWDESVLEYVDESSRHLTAEQSLQAGNKGYRVKVKAYEEGIYPFRVVSKVRDTLITYADTLRLEVLGYPRAFVQDTVYACLGTVFNAEKYVDKVMVKKINSSTPADLQHVDLNASPLVVYAYQVEILDKCLSVGAGHRLEKDSLVIIAEAPAYISMMPPALGCPGEEFSMVAPTNGRSDWYKQTKFPTGGYSAREQIAGDVPEGGKVSLTIGTDTVLYTIEAHTLCPDNSEASVTFGAYPKPYPRIQVRDTFACGSESIELKADYDASVAGAVSWTVNGKPFTQTQLKSENPTQDSKMTVVGSVTGTLVDVNDCTASDTAVITFYASPAVSVSGTASAGLLCVEKGELTRIQAQGDASNLYEWFLQGSDKTSLGTGAILNRAFSKDTLIYVVAKNDGRCSAADSVRIVLYGDMRMGYGPDTTVCVGSDFSMSMPGQEGVSYRWYGPDGTSLCPCVTYDFEKFAAEDAGVYFVDIVRNGCVRRQDIDIKTYPVPVMDFGEAGSSPAFCEGTPLVLQVHPKVDGTEVPGYFVWTDPSGREILEGDNRNTYVKGTALVADQGTYKVSLTLKNGCVHDTAVKVRVDEHTQPSFELNPFYCEGDTVILHTDWIGAGITYEWYNDAGRHIGPDEVSYKNVHLPDVKVQDAGALYLVVRKGACSDTTFRELEVRERPEIGMEVQGGSTLNEELYFCEGDAASIVLKNVLAGDSILWSLPGGVEVRQKEEWHIDAVVLADGGEYSAVSVRKGCASEEVSVNLDVRVVPTLVLQDTFLCRGREVVVNVENPDYPGATYAWRELGLQASEVRLDKAGEYHVTMNLKGCEDEGAFLLSERPVPQWEFPSDTTICDRDSLLLQGPEGADSYLWQDGSQQAWMWVSDDGLYTLTVTDSGCAEEKSVYVGTEFCSPVFFASAFTPDGDGINDEFGPISIADADEVDYEFWVYGANGQLVFHSTDIGRSWNGTFKGKPCPPGIYPYRCKIIVLESGRDISRKGTVHLIR